MDFFYLYQNSLNEDEDICKCFTESFFLKRKKLVLVYEGHWQLETARLDSITYSAMVNIPPSSRQGSF